MIAYADYVYLKIAVHNQDVFEIQKTILVFYILISLYEM